MTASNPLLEKAARFIQSAELLFGDGDIALLLADAIDFLTAGRDWLKKHPNVTQDIE